MLPAVADGIPPANAAALGTGAGGAPPSSAGSTNSGAMRVGTVVLCAQTGALASSAPPRPSVASQAASGKRRNRGVAPIMGDISGECLGKREDTAISNKKFQANVATNLI